MAEPKELLKSNAIFQDMPDEWLEELLGLAERRQVKAGEVLFTELDEATEIELIVSGEVQGTIALANADVGARSLTLGAGEITGDVAYIEVGKRGATAIAVTDAELLVWQAADWTRLAEENYELGYRLVRGIARNLCRRLRQWHTMLVDDVSWGLD